MRGTSANGSRSTSPAESRRESKESRAVTAVTSIRVPVIAEENSSEGQDALPEASHDLYRGLEECWRLCVTFCELTSESRKQLFAQDISADESETTWNLCWSLCQSTFNANKNDSNQYDSHLRMQTRIARDLFNALLAVRSGDDRTGSLLRAATALSNHLHSGLPVELPPAYDQRTLDFYFELCSQLITTTTSLNQAFLAQLQACWALTSASHQLRQHQTQSHKISDTSKQKENELLTTTLDACFNLCNLFYDAYFQARDIMRLATSPSFDTELGPTPRASQVSFSTYPIRPAFSSAFPSMDSAMLSPRTMPPPRSSNSSTIKAKPVHVTGGFKHPFASPATSGIVSASIPNKPTHSHHNSASKTIIGETKHNHAASGSTARTAPPKRPTSAPAVHPLTPPNHASSAFPETPLTMFSDLDHDPMDELERAAPPGIVVLSMRGSLGGEDMDYMPSVSEAGSRRKSFVSDRSEKGRGSRLSERYDRLR